MIRRISTCHLLAFGTSTYGEGAARVALNRSIPPVAKLPSSPALIFSVDKRAMRKNGAYHPKLLLGALPRARRDPVLRRRAGHPKRRGMRFIRLGLALTHNAAVGIPLHAAPAPLSLPHLMLPDPSLCMVTALRPRPLPSYALRTQLARTRPVRRARGASSPPHRAAPRERPFECCPHPLLSGRPARRGGHEARGTAPITLRTDLASAPPHPPLAPPAPPRKSAPLLG